jgi:hypothetical protein
MTASYVMKTIVSSDNWILPITMVSFNTNNVSSPDVFNAALESIFANLSAEAASGSKLYASGTTTDSLFRKIYALVQCWRDISSDDCTTCLSNTINYIFAVYVEDKELRV